MAGSSRDQGVLLHRGPHQLGSYTSPNKCLAYPRTLYPTEYRPTLAWTKLFPDLTWTGYSQLPARIRPILGVKAAQARLYYGYTMAWAALYFGVYYGLRGYELV